MKAIFPLFLLLLLNVSCTNAPLRGKDVLGADEFVMDSFKIREGKFAILELEGKETEEISEELHCEYVDRIQDGDILKIVIHHPTRPDIGSSVQRIGSSVGFVVAQGMIHLPDLDPVCVKGLTLEEAQQAIQQRYGAEIKEVEVFVSYQERIERKVELIGCVANPSIAVDGKKRLYDVLAAAKIAPNANLFKSYVLRQNRLLPVDLCKLVKEGDMRQNIIMQGGDKIYIAEPDASTIMVMGEVMRPQVVNIPNGTIPINQALATAGGLSLAGDRTYIQVIRGAILNPKIYSLNWEHIVRLRSDSLLLIPGDIVFVSARPLSQWNRFVGEVLPTIIAVDLAARGGKNLGINVP
jgi:polysaccharide biosynthesis/export protein